jgi:hypothetical protein
MPRASRKPAKTQTRRQAPKSPHMGRRAAKHPPTALVVRAPGPKPWLIQPEELTILKNAMCKNATDVELQYCLTVARRRGLDPFKGQIWFVPRNDRSADDGAGGRGGKVWIPVTSIGGLCHVGARDHKDYGSFSEPEFGPAITVEWQYKGSGPIKKLQVPEWARVKAFKKGATEPTVGIVWWTEIYPNIDYAPMVRQMPRRMLSKCAQAQAIRLAYPETGGLYIAEEMQEVTAPQFTPEGRTIIEKTPQEQAYEAREQENLKNMTPAQREVVERKMREAEERKKQPPIDIQPPRAEPEDNFDGVLMRLLPTGEYSIGGMKSVLRNNWDLLKLFWREPVKKILCSPQALGGLCRRLEERNVKFRMLGDGDD